MIRPAVVVIALTALALLAACTGHSHRHAARSAADWQRILEDPQRDAWQRPAEVVAQLKLRADEVVADIGAGSGYFTRRLAPHVKTVYAVEIDPKLLEMVTRSSPANVQTVLAAPDDPRLPAGAVDTVFICNVLHHIADRPAYFAKLRAALKPGGRIVIVDFVKRAESFGPPVGMRLADSEVIAELAGAGFKLARRWDGLPRQYLLEFS